MASVTDCKEQVGPGWGTILEQLHEELMVIYPAYQVAQVKEKFGTLRVYLNTYPREIWQELSDVITKYEKMTAVTCEGCGEPGRLCRPNGSWVLTLCERCEEHRKKDRSWRAR